MSSTAQAGIYADHLSRCLVTQTTDGDKLQLAQWIFTVMSVHPSAASLSKVSDADMEQVAIRTAQLFERLLADACKGEAASAVKYEGAEAIGAAFKVLGEIAMTTLLGNARVEAQTQAFVKHLDLDSLRTLFANPQPAP